MIPISVCIITKNEAENLEKCLSALKLYPFEIVVTDTGSNDSSKEIAENTLTKSWISLGATTLAPPETSVSATRPTI